MGLMAVDGQSDESLGAVHLQLQNSDEVAPDPPDKHRDTRGLSTTSTGTQFCVDEEPICMCTRAQEHATQSTPGTHTRRTCMQAGGPQGVDCAISISHSSPLFFLLFCGGVIS